MRSNLTDSQYILKSFEHGQILNIKLSYLNNKIKLCVNLYHSYNHSILMPHWQHIHLLIRINEHADKQCWRHWLNEIDINGLIYLYQDIILFNLIKHHTIEDVLMKRTSLSTVNEIAWLQLIDTSWNQAKHDWLLLVQRSMLYELSSMLNDCEQLLVMIGDEQL